MSINRRALLKSALAAGVVGATKPIFGYRDGGGGMFGYEPFTQPFFKPPVIHKGTSLDPMPGTPEASLGSDAVYHGVAPEYYPAHPAHLPDWDTLPEKYWELEAVEGVWQFFPGVDTPVFAYRGKPGTASETPPSFPGPTFLARHGEPTVVRYSNLTSVETSIHLHGDHGPAHSDGSPDFYVLQDKTRDYYYPNIGPRLNATPDTPYPATVEEAGPFELAHLPTTMWYHDHAMDITGFNVNRGLAGFYLSEDDLEVEHQQSGFLPKLYGDFDHPLVLKDFKFNGDGTLAYDLLDHNGHIGDVKTANGRAQPYMDVYRRKYRFRILNGCNARYLHLRLNSSKGEDQDDGIPFLMIGKDTWEIEEATDLDSFTISPGERFDVIIDFSQLSEDIDTYYLQNIMHQTDGRKPKGIRPDKEHAPWMQFRLLDGDPPGPQEIEGVENGVYSVSAGDTVREYHAYSEDEVVATRLFEFSRKHGAWVVNSKYYSPRRTDAVPLLNSCERWIFKNGGGGWFHPIHVHLEGVQVQSIDGKDRDDSDFPVQYRWNTDLINLEGGEEAVCLIKFRTFKGPFVCHCHIIEHEDMRMMFTFDPREAGEESMNDGIRNHAWSEEAALQSGMPTGCIDPHHLLFDHEQTLASGEVVGPGDVPQLEEEGVGFPGDFHDDVCEPDSGDWDPEGGQLTTDSPMPEEQEDR
jgi:FtsP/CotA-like multicopper oxidase with cupredoxin domain